MRLDLSLYLVTDPEMCAERGLEDTVAAAVRGGVTLVQLRDKHASDAELVPVARRLKTVLAGSGVPLLINDRLEVALASGADGLHIGQDDGDVDDARAALGPDATLGLSVQTHEQLARIEAGKLDYLGLGPVFATPSKHDHAAPLGFEGLAALVDASPLPTVAIGGLKAEHVEAVRQTGANGLAVISAICGKPDPEAAARDFFQPAASSMPRR
ncbi:thiamine phosphate synthase [Halomonas caseinilytica]|uniref:Thiamine-phosphate synthase n=1 Tax=Halomonas caseinilytica TaxID=438744 RepID=A0A1M7ANY6_9GAMM|nr:thiamine phosphate synthase [Halomonas caseinilytica]SEN30052.1 thiamine-phosphate pyrophosphorylase [Halomonas caseinilytica]SHL44375.1 thiamine-phosphate diphosphorylase [Halomonas caseinilytica]